MLLDRRLRGGGFGGELSKPLSTSDEEQELNSMSVAIQLQIKTDREWKFSFVHDEKRCAIVCGENF